MLKKFKKLSVLALFAIIIGIATSSCVATYPTPYYDYYVPTTRVVYKEIPRYVQPQSSNIIINNNLPRY